MKSIGLFLIVLFSTGYCWGDHCLWKAELVRVVDGDTVDVNVYLGLGIYRQERIRLEAIDVCESHTVVGRKATLFVKKVLKGQLFIKVPRAKSRGKYGRLLADIGYNTDTTRKWLTTELRRLKFEKKQGCML